MKYEWYADKEESHLSCEGEMYNLEIRVQDDGVVVGEIWVETRGTYLDPPDWETVREDVYSSIDEAKLMLESYDADEARAMAKWERELDAILNEEKF